MDDFDREIEIELHRRLDSIDREPIPPRRLVQSGTPRTRALVGGAGAALAAKLISGVAIAAAAVTVAGATATGSLDPAVWGQQVTDRVQECKAALAAGQHGIGDCVSAFASTHGAGVASHARHQGIGNGNGYASGRGKGNGNGTGNGTGNVNGNAHGHDKEKPNPASSKSPAGAHAAPHRTPRP